MSIIAREHLWADCGVQIAKPIAVLCPSLYPERTWKLHPEDVGSSSTLEARLSSCLGLRAPGLLLCWVEVLGPIGLTAIF